MKIAKSERVDPTPETVAKLRTTQISHLEPSLQRYALAVAYAFNLITADLRYVISAVDGNFTGAGNVDWTDHQKEMVAIYWEWRDELAKSRIPINCMIDLIVYDVPHYEIDRKMQIYEGTTRSWLLEAMGIYEKLEGVMPSIRG